MNRANNSTDDNDMALRVPDSTYGYGLNGGFDATTDSMMSASQTLSVPSHFTYTTSPTSSDSSYLAGMLETSSRASGGSPLLSLSSAGDASPLTAFSGLSQTPGTLFRSTSLSGSNFGDYLDVGDVATVAGSAQASPSTSLSGHDFSFYYNGGSGSGSAGGHTFGDLSPLNDRSQYASPQGSWLSNVDDDFQQASSTYSLSPHIAYESQEVTMDVQVTQGSSANAFSFPTTADPIMAWSHVPSLESTTSGGFQLPPAMKDTSKTTRFLNTAANAKLPQVVTTSYNDNGVSNFVGLDSGSASSSTLSARRTSRGDDTGSAASGHKRGTLGNRRGSNVSNRGGSSPYDTPSSSNVRKAQSSSKHGRGGGSGSGSGSGGGSGSGSRNKFVCERPDCNGPVFTRMADLERHTRHIHTAADKKERFLCDYASCSRNTTPFHRKDHYREHLREYHLEDLLKRGSNANHQTAASSSAAAGNSDALPASASSADIKKNKKLLQEAQLQNCRTETDWWRCARCLHRVDIATRQWTCPTCKGSIEEPRKSIRLSRTAQAMAASSAMAIPTGWGLYNDMSLDGY